MTMRKQGPLYDIWHRRVEGQIRHTMNCHPEWFERIPKRDVVFFVNSLAKRIVGEIVAASKSGDNLPLHDVHCANGSNKAEMISSCQSPEWGCDDMSSFSISELKAEESK